MAKLKFYEAKVLLEVTKIVRVKAKNQKQALERVQDCDYWEEEYDDTTFLDVQGVMEGPNEVLE